MKQLLLMTLFFFTDANGLSRLTPSRDFGTKNFIVGYPHHRHYQTTRQYVHQAPRLSRTLFSHKKHNISAEVLKIIAQAQNRIDVAAFSLTDARIANQLIDAYKQRGVDVCVIVDASNMNNKYSKVEKLIKNGITVLRYDPTLRTDHKQKNHEAIMHLKWIITDNTLIVGSANFTRSAQNGDNIESITIFTCPHEVEDHRNAFQDLKKLCIICT